MIKVILPLGVFLLYNGCEPKYLKFDNDLPGETPKLFAKNLISKNNEHVGYCTFSPDGNELYYAITNDGNTMYFMAILPPKNNEVWHADQYRANKTANGWGSPERLDTIVNSKASEWHVSLTDNNMMYFT